METIEKPITPKEQILNTKEQLVNNIKEWIKIDNEIAQFKTEIKERTNKKKLLTENLVSVMKTNSIDCFDINGGALIYKKNKVKKPLTGKTLLTALQNYYKNDVKTAEEITKHIMDSREEQFKETIKRKKDK
jgi:phage gpG-like protein